MVFNIKEDIVNIEFVCVGVVLIGSRIFWVFMLVYIVFMKTLVRYFVVFYNIYNCIYIDIIYNFFFICIRKWKVEIDFC